MSSNDTQRLISQRLNPRIVRLWTALQPLKNCVSFMNTGAHPDDETTSMLAALILRDGVKVSHACSTRGEGGQNALGKETTHDLGVIRTREMEQAAKVLGFTQYWHSETPEDTIFDFGFSKSGDETLNKWGKERTLERFVYIIRRERPDIVCPTFLDISGQHGHHRAMTRSAFDAVKLAADPDAFPEQGLPVWQVKKLYLPAWSGAGDAYDDDVPPPPESVVVDATGSDPVLGADYLQIAQWSRMFHKTQGMGHWVDPGQPNVWPLHLAWVASGVPAPEKSITDGLPNRLRDLPEFADAPTLATDLIAADGAIVAMIDSFPDHPGIIQHALSALKYIGLAQKNCPCNAKSEVLHRLAAKRRQLTAAIVVSADLRATLDISPTTAQPGSTVTAKINLFSQNVVVEPNLVLPAGWQSKSLSNDTYEITVPDDAKPSDPYPDTWHPDRANSPISLQLEWEIDGQRLSYAIDPIERLNVLPKYSATLSAPNWVVRTPVTDPIRVALKNIHPQGAKVSLKCPMGWKSKISKNEITLTPSKSIAPGQYQFQLSLDGHPASTTHAMQYDHIGSVFRSAPTTIDVLVLDMELPKGRIAYIGGGSDQIDLPLRSLGMSIDSIPEHRLADLDLAAYDSILIGIFAFRTRPALNKRLGELHEWVKSGGNLVTLYHRPWDNWDPDRTPSAHLEIGKPSLRWRVTDENATVTQLQPDHVLLTTPNRIGPADWDGWQKERGLYFAAAWDAVYQPLLSMADANEQPLTGALLSAEIGAGRHTHTSLILHHQVENLVPGAIRIIANLLSNDRVN